MIKPTNLSFHCRRMPTKGKVPMAETMNSLTEERKQEIINKQPDGL
jgi:hypothetical protein